MIEIPQWRPEAKPVWIYCKTIRPLPDDQETIVQFDLDGKEYTSFVRNRFVNHANRGLGACIIADVSGGVLVDIPSDTFTTGPRLLVKDESVLMPFDRD